MSDARQARPAIEVEWIRTTPRRKFRFGELYCRFSRRRLRVEYGHSWKNRRFQVVSLVVEALEALGGESLRPFYLNVSDLPFRKARWFRTRFSACAADGFPDMAAPDFVFNGWPDARFDDFDAKIAAIRDASQGPPLDPRAFWAGRVNTDARRALAQAASARPDLIQIRDMQPSYDDRTLLYAGAFLSMEEQAATYRYLIDAEGWGYSGRLKLLLHSGRVVLLQAYPWREWYDDLIEPFRHYVPVAADFSDIAERIEWLRANPRREAEIVREAQAFAAAHLTRAGAVRAWANLLQKHEAAWGGLRPERRFRLQTAPDTAPPRPDCTD